MSQNRTSREWSDHFHEMRVLRQVGATLRNFRVAYSARSERIGKHFATRQDQLRGTPDSKTEAGPESEMPTYPANLCPLFG